jgi:hypothetical protein
MAPAEDPIIAAHKHSRANREEILKSDQCGCLYCLHTFRPEEISQWCDESSSPYATAVCPHCGIDSVLGDRSGHPLAPEFLAAMKKRWFLKI